MSLLDNPYAEYFKQAGQQYNIDPNILAAQAMAESGLNPNAVSKAGAQGIAQFMPGTAEQMGLTDPFNPSLAIPAQAKYLDYIRSQGITDPEQMLAAYNAGPGAVKKYGGIPPYAETKNYVDRIKGYLDENNTPLTIQNLIGKPSAGVDLSMFSRPKDKKMTGAEKAAAFLGILGSIGGLVASTAAPFKGVSGDPGASAMKIGGGLLESLIGSQKENKISQDFFDAVINSNINDETKANVLSFAQRGLTAQAQKMFNDAISTENDIRKITDAGVVEAKIAQMKANQAANLDTFKAKEDYKKQLNEEYFKSSTEALSQLDALGDNITPEQKLQKQVLQAKLKLKSADESPFTKARKDKLIDDINKETGPVNVVLQGLKGIDEALKNIPSGRTGYVSKGLNQLTGSNPAYQKFSSNRDLIKSLTSRVAGQTGVLTEQDVKFIENALPNETQTIAERNEAMKAVMSFINSKVSNYRKVVSEKEYGKDYLGFYDNLVNLGDLGEKYLKNNTNSEVKTSANVQSNQPQTQTESQPSILEKAKQIPGVTIRPSGQ